MGSYQQTSSGGLGPNMCPIQPRRLNIRSCEESHSALLRKQVIKIFMEPENLGALSIRQKYEDSLLLNTFVHQPGLLSPSLTFYPQPFILAVGFWNKNINLAWSIAVGTPTNTLPSNSELDRFLQLDLG